VFRVVMTIALALADDADDADDDFRICPFTRLDLPGDCERLADFAPWVSACEETLGMQPGEAIAACRTNSAEARDLALEASPLYVPLAELAREGFTGTVAELHARLDSMVSDAMRRSVRWPKAPNGLGNALRRMATNLRGAGVELQFSRNDVQGRRVVSVVAAARKTPSVAVSSRQ
jgi:hypothetical protein